MGNKHNYRITIALLMLALALVLAGCGKNSRAEAPATPEVTAAPAATAAPEVTTAPEVTATPEVTAAPAATAAPAVTAAPAATAAPEVSATAEVPAATAAPAATATPAAPVESTVPPAAPVESTVPAAPVQDPVQAQSAAPGGFTGVMGTAFVVPDGFIQLDEEAGIGYQYTFWHPDYDVRITVNEIPAGYLPDGAYDADFNSAKNDPDVTYFNNGESWFVQSGYSNNGAEIFYAKESNSEAGLKSFRITYPTANRAFGDRITTEFEAGLSF